jgi:hypothetical protein
MYGHFEVPRVDHLTTHIISTSALAPKPDIRATDLHYRNVPEAEMAVAWPGESEGEASASADS